MSRPKLRLAAATLLCLVSTLSSAQLQQPMPLGVSGDYRIAISSPSQTTRIGNAVLLRYYAFKVNEKYGRSSQFLFSCDGSWVSTEFRDVFHFGEALTFSEQEKEAVSKEDSLVSYATEQTAIGTSEIAFVDQIARRLTAICKNAGREPKNTFITVAVSEIENDLFNTISLVTGTSAKIDGAIDVWMRTTEYKRAPFKGPDGSPVLLKGVVQKLSEPTGKYSLARNAYDCRQRRMGTYALSSYAAGQVTPETNSIDRDKLRLSAVAPGTVGENQLDWVCALYGSIGK